MRIVLFGKNGQLGWELQRSLAPLGEVIAMGTHDQPCANFTLPSDVATTTRKLAPDVIVNAAAYTAVDKAESNLRDAALVNSTTPGMLAQVAQDLDALFVHYSTDYVFDGSGSKPWKEDAPTNPLNAYGRTKLAGENQIRLSGCKHLIFRTSWVYGMRGSNFAKTMLQLAQTRDTLKVINDQIGAPTGAELLADITAHALLATMAQPELVGIYHVSSNGETSWHGYARYVLTVARKAGLPVTVDDSNLLAIPSSDFPTPARRPLNSRLDTNKLCTAFGLHLPDWHIGMDRMLAELLQN